MKVLSFAHYLLLFFNAKAKFHSFIPAFPFLSLFSPLLRVFPDSLSEASDANFSHWRPYFLDCSQKILIFIHFPRGFFLVQFHLSHALKCCSSHAEWVVHNEAWLHVRKDLMMALLCPRILVLALVLLSASIWLLSSCKQSTFCRHWHLPPDSGGLISTEGMWKDAVTSGASAFLSAVTPSGIQPSVARKAGQRLQCMEQCGRGRSAPV